MEQEHSVLVEEAEEDEVMLVSYGYLYMNGISQEL